MRFIHSITLFVCILFIICLSSCNNFFVKDTSTVNIELPSNLFDVLCSREADDTSEESGKSFTLQATMSGSVNRVQSKSITEKDGPVSILFNTIPINSVITVEVKILSNNVELYAGKSAETIVNSVETNMDITLSPTTKTYKITYELNGGEWADSYTAPTTYTTIQPTILPGVEEVLLGGKVFVGWYTNPKNSGDVFTTIPAGTTGDIVLYAKWELGTCGSVDEIATAISALTSSELYTCVVTGNYDKDGIKPIGDALFSNDNNIQVALDLSKTTGLTELDYNFVSGRKGLVSIIIPDSVTTIKEETFKDCINLESVSIPKSVDIIEAKAFNSCTKLTSFNIDSDNKAYIASDSKAILMSKDKKNISSLSVCNG